jgi:predicted ATPase
MYGAMKAEPAVANCGRMLIEEHRIVGSPTFCDLLTALCHLGRAQEAQGVIALARAEEKDEFLWLPDIFRTRSEALQELPKPDLAMPRLRSFVLSKHAKQQAALSWELRAAIPLARMWIEHSRWNDASSVLERRLQRFDEGIATRDLVTARRLLHKLG